MKKVCGIGINDYCGNIHIGGKTIKSYDSWRHMLFRCYSVELQNKNPTYIGTTVCDEWLYFSKFKEWYDANYPYHLEEQGVKLNLDKDILSGEKKIYSPDTCCFIPQKVNGFMTNIQRTNTSGYTGVCWESKYKKWRVQINDFNSNKRTKIGRFANIEDAKNAYIKAREVEAEKCKKYLRELGYNENIINKIK